MPALLVHFLLPPMLVASERGSIVAIDDDRDILDLVQTVLEMEGYHVIPISHPDDVEPRLQGQHPNLFLVDIMLQQTSGIELAQRLRERGLARAPMIGMSASPLMLQLAHRSGMFATTIDKPFEIDALLDTVEAHLV